MTGGVSSGNSWTASCRSFFFKGTRGGPPSGPWVSCYHRRYTWLNLNGPHMQGLHTEALTWVTQLFVPRPVLLQNKIGPHKDFSVGQRLTKGSTFKWLQFTQSKNTVVFKVPSLQICERLFLKQSQIKNSALIWMDAANNTKTTLSFMIRWYTWYIRWYILCRGGWLQGSKQRPYGKNNLHRF